MQCSFRKETKKNGNSITTTVQGREVALIFANAPNTQVVAQVRQALLGAYFPAKR